MKTTYIIFVLFLISASLNAADLKPEMRNDIFPVFSDKGIVVAASVSSGKYSKVTNKEADAAGYTNAHEQPEFLVNELYKALRTGNVSMLKTLYDTTFKESQIDPVTAAEQFSKFKGLEYYSRFELGEIVVIRFNLLLDKKKKMPWFTGIKKFPDGYYLTNDLVINDPFNLIGSLSPINLEQGDFTNDVNGLISLYLVRDSNNYHISLTNPGDNYIGLYLNLETPDKTQYASFFNDLIVASKSSDTGMISTMFVQSELSGRESDEGVIASMQDLKFYFSRAEKVDPLAVINYLGNKIIYYRLTESDGSSIISSVAVKNTPQGYRATLLEDQLTFREFIFNGVIKEAIYTNISSR